MLDASDTPKSAPAEGLPQAHAEAHKEMKDLKELSKKFSRRDGATLGLKTMDKAERELELTNPDPGLDAEIAAAVDVGNASEFMSDDRAGKDAPARLYRKVDLTQELAENNYYKLTIQQQVAALIGVSHFWVDYAKHDGQSPFLSRNLADASRNFTEMMLALAVLDLPFTAAKHEVKFEDGKMTFIPGGIALAFHEEVKPVAGLSDKVQILVSQNFYRSGDRYKDENGERLDKFVTDEFVIHTVYGCQVVVTNPTPSRQRLSVLIQIPVGALAVSNGQPTKTVSLDLEPYHTQIVDYQFYFPKAGQYAHFPVHVAKAETLVAAATAFTFNVVDKPTKLDTESWDYVSQNGTPEQVAAMIEPREHQRARSR